MEGMLTRRAIVMAAGSLPFVLGVRPSVAGRRGREVITLLQFPPPASISHPQGRASAGLGEPSTRQVAHAKEILRSMPRGPRPLDIAQAFVDRFYRQDPAAISQPPPPGARNPLISAFLEGTGIGAAEDVVPWCAAFANFCIVRSGLSGSGSASSQSFLDPPFQPQTKPEEGDLAVFTCYGAAGQNLRLGHVAFFKETVDADHIRVVGGNQSAGGHSSIICESTAQTTNHLVRRRTSGGRSIEAMMRLSAYVSVA